MTIRLEELHAEEFGPKPGQVWLGEPDLGGWYTQEEVDALSASLLNSLDWTVGFAPHQEIRAFEDEFAKFIGVQYAIAINGAGTGLDMFMRALQLSEGDEVISCGLNFPGTHLAVIGHGGKLILAEADPVTLNICPMDVERKLSTKTRAILVTHINGAAADVDLIEEIAARHPHPQYGPPKVFVDAARACGATCKGLRVGVQGSATVFSFQRKKLMTTLGEGGMIVTNDAGLYLLLDEMRSFGKSVSWGTNYKMTKPQAAVGRVQLRRLDYMNSKRINVANERSDMLRETEGITLPSRYKGFDHLFYLYVILLDSDIFKKRPQIFDMMRNEYALECKNAHGPTRLENSLIYHHTIGQRTPIADSLGERVICLPLHPLMTSEQNSYIVNAFKRCLASV